MRPRNLLLFGCAILLLSLSAMAQNKSRIKQQTPTISGATGLFNIPNADTLREGEFSFSFFSSKFNREIGDIDITQYPVSFTLGLHDRVEFFASYEVYKRVNSQGLRVNRADEYLRVLPPGSRIPLTPSQIRGGGGFYYNDTPFMDLGFGDGPGDLVAGFKFNLLSERYGDGVGLAIRPIFRFAINSDDTDLRQGLSPGANDYGFDIIVSKDAGPATLTVTSGLVWAEDLTYAERQNRFNYGFGVDVPMAQSKVHFMAELIGSTFWGDRTVLYSGPHGEPLSAQGNPRSPVDVYAGFRFFPHRMVAISAAYNYYMNQIDETLYRIDKTDRHGWFAQVALQRKVNRPPVVECSADASTVVQGGSVKVNISINDPDDDNLTVTWKSSGGRIESMDTSATFDSTGLAPGNYMVMGEATDGDNIASCSVDITVEKPKAPPTVVCQPATSSVMMGQSTTLRAQASDPNGDALTYAWSVDGQAVTNDSPSFEFGSAGRSAGAHRVRVTVTDVDSMSANCEFTVNIDSRPNNPPTVDLTLDKASVFACDPVMATAKAADPDNDPLTYSWTVDGQPASGSGSTLSINTCGMAGGSHSVSVTVRDSKGASATDTATFNVREKITIQIDRTPDNIAKAKLDEIALKMQQNPRLQALIVGHTDSEGSEEANMKVGQRRADALKDYLVKQHQIDASRIETRSAGSSQPIADNGTAEGRKQNRRGEVELFVP